IGFWFLPKLIGIPLVASVSKNIKSVVKIHYNFVTF
ncbi:DUF2306 domain-containing protein, partial [Bacillus anthracis]|nr:DUF2306 domain-containing protein [Bacillus anthracis]